MSAGKAAEGVPGATTKKVVLVCPYASCLGFSGRSQRKPTLGDAGKSEVVSVLIAGSFRAVIFDSCAS